MLQPGQFRELSQLLPKFSEVLIRNSQLLDNVLETLELQTHSMVILAVLSAKLVHASNINNLKVDDFIPLLIQIKDFVNGFDVEQIKLVGELYAEMCHILTDILVDLEIPMRGINVLCMAIKKIQTSKSQLTSVHADLCKLCLLAKSFKPALEFLDVDVTNINIEDDSKYFLLYYYYGGMIYTALKNYENALYFYEVCVMTPASAVSHIMIEAYKKYILVSLILTGKVNLLPNYTSNLIKR